MACLDLNYSVYVDPDNQERKEDHVSRALKDLKGNEEVTNEPETEGLCPYLELKQNPMLILSLFTAKTITLEPLKKVIK